MVGQANKENKGIPGTRYCLLIINEVVAYIPIQQQSTQSFRFQQDKSR